MKIKLSVEVANSGFDVSYKEVNEMLKAAQVGIIDRYKEYINEMGTNVPMDYGGITQFIVIENEVKEK